MSAKQVSRSANQVGKSNASPPRGFDKDLAELEAFAETLRLQPVPDAAQVAYLRKILTHKSNFLVSKAAKLVADTELISLLPDILAAFDRFFTDAAKTDPQCWAKNALSKALVKLGHRTVAEYLRGMRHHQMEPSFGPPVDTAGALRGTCTHALVDCPGISDSDLLTALLEPFTDIDKTVRMEAARAIGQVGGVSATLILRLRAMLGPGQAEQEEPEVLGEVYRSLLSLEGAQAIPIVASRLEPGDDLAAEAAFALADLRTPEALKPLVSRFEEGADTWFASVLLSAIAQTRLPAAVDFLVSMIERDGREAAAAIEAIGRIVPNAELRARIQQAVDQAGSPRLQHAFRQHVPSVPE
jgi:HEAT repeat protein